LTPRERELMTGMGNCYASCHEDFEHTVEMVGDARGLTGNYRGRECVALFQGKKYGFNIRFDSKGGIDLFSERA